MRKALIDHELPQGICLGDLSGQKKALNLQQSLAVLHSAGCILGCAHSVDCNCNIIRAHAVSLHAHEHISGPANHFRQTSSRKVKCLCLENVC
jgi:hypothetical protein